MAKGQMIVSCQIKVKIDVDNVTDMEQAEEIAKDKVMDANLMELEWEDYDFECYAEENTLTYCKEQDHDRLVKYIADYIDQEELELHRAHAFDALTKKEPIASGTRSLISDMVSEWENDYYIYDVLAEEDEEELFWDVCSYIDNN